jgi:acyl dehydratase
MRDFMVGAPGMSESPIRYFEDLVVGSVLETASMTVSEQEIIEFATRFDPQYFHIDKAAAEKSMYGGLIASGWHSAAIAMRLMVDTRVQSAGLGSPGIDELRWIKPVRPGDTVRVRWTLIEARLSKTKPDRGLTRSKCELINQNDEIVMSYVGMGFIKRRP